MDKAYLFEIGEQVSVDVMGTATVVARDAFEKEGRYYALIVDEELTYDTLLRWNHSDRGIIIRKESRIKAITVGYDRGDF